MEEGIKVKARRTLDFFVIVLCLSGITASLYLFQRDLLQTINSYTAENAGTVTLKHNIVQRRQADRVLWDRLRAESPVYSGDLIRVAESSEAVLNIGNNQINLSENTLIQIHIDKNTSNIELFSGEMNLNTSMDELNASITVNGSRVRAGPGATINVTAREEGTTVQVHEGNVEFDGNGETKTITAGTMIVLDTQGNEQTEPVSLSPATTTEAAAVEVETDDQTSLASASVAEDEVSFSEPTAEATDLQTNSTSTFYMVDVLPPAETADQGSFSIPAVLESPLPGSTGKMTLIDFLSPVQNLTQPVSVSASEPKVPESAAEINRPQTASTPASPPPPKQPATPKPPPAPEAPPLPSPLLPEPANRQPPEGYRFGEDELRTLKNITFSWSPVAGANAYIFSLYQETNAGRRRIIQTIPPLTQTEWILDNFSILDRGTFVWQVETVTTKPDGTIDRRGRIGENTFMVDINLPGQVEAEDTGILYGR